MRYLKHNFLFPRDNMLHTR